MMQVFVGATAYQVDEAATVESLMYQVENKEFLPAGSFALVSGSGMILSEGDSLEADEELEMTLAVPAGMRKKWKKKRMRRLRRKVRTEFVFCQLD